MFDYYLPKPDIRCPVCGATNLEWQGKDGPCSLFVWEQGQEAPVDQRVDDEWRLPPDARVEHRLPARFEIYAQCVCPTFLTAIGITEREVWARTELLSPANAVAYPDESEREFRKRLAGYGPGHADL